MAIATIVETLMHWVVGGGTAQVLEVTWSVGHDPGTIVAKADEPIRVLFHRPGTNPASGEVCFPDFGILAMLTPQGTTTVELGRRPPGRYRFCAPDEEDLEGWLVVRR